MRQVLFVSSLVAALAGSASVPAQEPGMMQHHMHTPMLMPADGRQQVEFPVHMRQHLLANMRDHLQAIGDIMAAVAVEDYAKAGQIADARLGLDSPTAGSCKAGTGGKAKAAQGTDMESMMGQFMPEEMRKAGLAMHQAATAFSAEAAKATSTHDGKPVLAALSRVTQQCAACHSAYKVQ